MSALTREGVRALTSARSHSDRVRERTTTAAAAGIGVALLTAVAVLTVHDTVLTGVTTYYRDADGRQVVEVGRGPVGGLAPFLDQPGLRPGTAIAAVLLAAPFLALAVQALRTGGVLEQRRERQLSLAGAAPGDLRRLRAARTAAAFTRGGFWIAPAYLLLWLLLGVALPPGTRLLPRLQPELLVAWPALVLLLRWSGAALGASAPGTERTRGPLGAAVTAPSAPSRAHVAGLLALGLVLVAGGWWWLPLGIVPLAAGAALVLLAVRAATRRSALTGPRSRAGGGTAVSVLAAAQRRGGLAAATGTSAVLFVCGLSFGYTSAMAGSLLFPPRGGTEYDSERLTFYLSGAGLAAAVGAVAAAVALVSLLLGLTDHLAGTRRAVASTAALGVPVRTLVAVQARCLTSSAVPPVVAGTLIGGLPLGIGLLVTSSPGSLAPLLAALTAGLVVALACRSLARALSGRVRAASALENLRVP
ncbi:hypothetical protein [Kineococcus auxinigenes]|uniref:hypothetical protein n=1 Tax=unclassified Kineococcus TaxID=2621656 RepID=UPI003D7D04D5